ncbi:uncharacterized protein LOC115649033 [Gopherus evgoodei]|uniref:uncharacterized protein LOC115649033 n=1 Tax=Gopherus evgoodei TaxID=1825980 RepID=UPI0011D02B87|nr:uncharacterized protein LOC115649033 [Gopherus evgoodei]
MPSVHLQRASSLNPATLISSPDEGHLHHGCLKVEPMDLPLVKETKIPDAPCLYVDGSSFYVNGKRHTGWAVCTQDGQLVAHGSLPAQVAELQALIAACEAAEGHAINIYTDSRYAFGVVHDYVNLWVNRGFLTSTGSPIQNGGIVQKLHATMQKPTEVAVIKVKAHTKGTDPHSKGNRRADELAKQAAVESKETQLIAATQPLIKTPNFFELQDIHHAAPRAEKWLWMDNGGKLCDDNTWRGPGNTLVLPNVLMGTMIQVYHMLGHDGARRVIHSMSNTWWHPKLNANVHDYVRRCVTCAQCNSAPTVKVRMRHQPRPTQPFEQLPIDFIGPLPRCRGKEYVLVIMDHFTKWVEAFPVAKATAADVAKVLM